MPLVVSCLMGDASDVFDWILSLNPGNTQDLTTLLQMLWGHYCGSLTFREQRNTIENLSEASGGHHRLLNKSRYLCEQLGQRLEG